MPGVVKTLLIDNFDSFTFNLYQLIAEVNGQPPTVVRNNAGDWDALKTAGFDNIVISPGPGRADSEVDFGICAQVIREAQVPVLGVCLGHQGLCQTMGGEVEYLRPVMHGRISQVFHQQDPLFGHIPSPFAVVRYHSLVVSKVPSSLQVIAQTADGANMAVRHRHRPMWGVQFHPESVCTEYGRQLLVNFHNLTKAWYGPGFDASAAASKPAKPAPVARSGRAPLKVFFRRLASCLQPSLVFKTCFAASNTSFWLDSECFRSPQGRFSYMGDAAGPQAQILEYSQQSQLLRVRTHEGESVVATPLFSYLNEQLAERELHNSELPFPFNLGYVGYLGYEMKGDCGYPVVHRADTPDACLLFADRICVFDHQAQAIYLVCVDLEEEGDRAKQWLHQMEQHLAALSKIPVPDAPHAVDKHVAAANAQSGLFVPAHTDQAYLELIARAKEMLQRGESYEICLTNQLSAPCEFEPLELFLRLRAENPAPYASYLCFDDLQVVSCSPERFLTIDQYGRVETKPIKGTRRRASTAAADAQVIIELTENEKERAENLMIVDLLRNDLGQVSKVGSVSVPALFTVETFETVHQMVSTVVSELEEERTAVDCVRACFPGGSMTGAPKKRTLEILDQLEGRARGVYSGAIGYFALNGSADWSIVIRSLVCLQGRCSLGVGGAITDLSDPRAELEETRVKAEAILRGVAGILGR
ncbi:aminodeoxychorismate synthase component I [Teredinibacter turnerae]|uniref:aminodeoxychorismate synthase component I n=1 Tax=Teredinibacter turnerae TaxID=2426 RepID=UPI0004191E41|nr:aminodeoxychorismate synthase component I [Teredinibacter turnerae]